MSRAFILLVVLTLTASTEAQTEAILNGFLYDASNGETLIGGNVFLRGTRMGSVTNLNGYYAIPKIPPGEYTLVASYLGYAEQTRKITLKPGEKRQINLNLQPEGIEGEEILVVADSIPTIRRLFDEPISRMELTGLEIKQIPQVIEADLMRSLQTIPGIVPVSDFSSALYVRGGTPDQNLFLIDGADVYSPEHAFGLFSTFNTDAIKQVDVSKGGFGAHYGGRLSSIMNVTNLDGNRKEFEGTAGISILSAKTTLQMPIGQKGSVSGSIRRTYFDQTIGRAYDQLPNYYFYDGNLKAFYEIDQRNTISASLFGGQDDLSFNFNDDATDKIGFSDRWGNRTSSLRWTRVLGSHIFSNFWITISNYRSDLSVGKVTDGGFTEQNDISDLTFKGNLEYHYSKQYHINFGFEQKNLRGVFKQSFPGGRVDVDASRKHYSAYVQNNFFPTDDWDIEGGLRYDYFDSDKNYQNLDPRLSVKYHLNETTNLKAAAGIYHQYLQNIPRPFLGGIWTTSDRYQSGSTAYHYIAGVEKVLPNDLQFEIEGYFKKYKNLYSLNQFFYVDIEPSRYDPDGSPVYSTTETIFSSGDGYSAGVELLLRRDVGAVTGWIGYSLAHTEYRVDRVNQGRSFAPRHDRTHNVNIVGNVNLRDAIRRMKGLDPRKTTSRWLLGINYVFASGQPISKPASNYLIGETPENGSPDLVLYPSDINAYRLPAYTRLDLSLTYEKDFRKWSIAPYLQIFNIGNRQNVWYVSYFNFDQDDDTVKRKTKILRQFPLLPSIGINFKF